MRLVLIVTAIFEATTALLILIVPAFFASMLLGASTLDVAGLLIARITGIALLTLATVCWLFRDSPNADSVVKAMFVYHLGVPVLLVYAYSSTGLDGKLLWPAVVAHAALLLWSLAVRLTRRQEA